MGLFERGVFLVLVIFLTGSGCARHATPVRRAASPRVPAEPQWGPAAEGVQCRLRPTKRVYAAGESPAFRVDLSNQGERVFALLDDGQAPVLQYAIDGGWRRWSTSTPASGKIRAFGPGVEILDLPAVLPGDARSCLSPGQHVIQVAFSFEGIEVLSNPVEIEIVGSR